MAEAVFQAEGVHFAYPGTPVISGLDLRMEAGRLYGVVGPNGSGKTTLLDLLAGVLKPAGGRVLFRGREAASIPRRELARDLALAPQEYGFRFAFPVEEAVMMGRHPRIPRFASPGAEDFAAVDRAIRAVGLAGLRHKPVTELSGGEKQRVVLARSLAQDTPALLLDEPTSSQDVRHALAVMGLARGLAGEGRTVVCVLHDLNLAATFCTHLVMLKEGRVLADGPTEEILTTANLREVFGVRAKVFEELETKNRLVAYHREDLRP